MNLSQYLPYVFLGAIMLFILALPILGTGLMLHIGHVLRREPMPWVFWLIALVVVAGPLQSGRNLSGLGAMFEVDPDRFTSSLWFNRFVSLAIVLIALERLLRAVVSREPVPVTGKLLLVAFTLYSVTNHFVNALFGTRPGFSHQAVYPLLAALAALLVAQRDARRCLLAARDALFLILVLSLVVLAVKPELVLQRGYSGGLLSVRYWGLGPHANVLSPLTVAFLALILVLPYRRAWLQAAGLAIGAASLLGTQSKTALGAMLLVLAVLAYYRFWAGQPPGALFRRPLVPMLLTGAILVGTVGLLVAQVGFDVFGRVSRFLGSSAGSQFTTLSSRDQIWAHAFREFEESPLFGYGPELFDAAYRVQIGLSQAFHGHNQAVHSLGAAGIVGLSGLLAYFAVLTWAAFRAAPASRGLSLALFTLVAVRAITEVPLTLRTASNSEFFIHLVLFITCIGYARVAPAATRAPVRAAHPGALRRQPV